MLLASFSATLLNILFLIICILLIIVVLLQRGRGGGLGAAFGGAGSSAFGTRTGDVFTWVTIVLTALFLVLAIGTAVLYRPDIGQVSTPAFDPPPGPVTEDITYVQIMSATQGVTIYYTIDGSDPTEDSRKYENSRIPVGPDTTVRARAFRAGLTPSEIATATYASPQAAAPSFDPPAGPLSEPTDVIITSETDGAIVRYTTDGSEPTAESTVYTGPIRVKPGMAIKARAFSPDPTVNASKIVEAAYSEPAPAETPTETPADANDGETVEVPATAPAAGEGN
jgi:protein translocase SecG subunit